MIGCPFDEILAVMGIVALYGVFKKYWRKMWDGLSKKSRKV